MTTPDEPEVPDQSSPSPPLTLGTAAQLLLGATAIAGALTFYAGWQYEKAYVEEWGLTFSAFSYSAADLMAISANVNILVTLAPLVAVFVIFSYSTRVNKVVFIAIVAPALIALLVGGALLFSGGFQRLALNTLTLGLFAGSVAIAFDRTVSRALAILLLGLCVLFIVLTTPRLLGQSDADGDRRDLSRLPRVQLILATTHPDLNVGPWRLIRANNGNLWLVPDVQGATQVTQLALSDAIAVEYLSNHDAPTALPTTRPVRSPAPP